MAISHVIRSHCSAPAALAICRRLSIGSPGGDGGVPTIDVAWAKPVREKINYSFSVNRDRRAAVVGIVRDSFGNVIPEGYFAVDVSKFYKNYDDVNLVELTGAFESIKYAKILGLKDFEVEGDNIMVLKSFQPGFDFTRSDFTSHMGYIHSEILNELVHFDHIRINWIPSKVNRLACRSAQWEVGGLISKRKIPFTLEQFLKVRDEIIEEDKRGKLRTCRTRQILPFPSHELLNGELW